MNIKKLLSDSIIIEDYPSNRILEKQIAKLQKRVKRLEQEGSYFDRVENIKEVRNLNGQIHI